MSPPAIAGLVSRALSKVDKKHLVGFFEKLAERGFPGSKTIQGVIEVVKKDPSLGLVVVATATPPVVDAFLSSGIEDFPELLDIVSQQKRATRSLTTHESFADRVQLLRDVKAVASRLGYHGQGSYAEFQRFQTALKAIIVFGPEDISDMRRV